MVYRVLLLARVSHSGQDWTTEYLPPWLCAALAYIVVASPVRCGGMFS